LTHFSLVDVDADDLLSESVLWKALVVDAGSVTVDLILLRLRDEVPVVDPDASQSCNSCDLAANTVWPSFVVHAVVSRLISPLSARVAPLFLRCESPH
jgi:hypothetical protein